MITAEGCWWRVLWHQHYTVASILLNFLQGMRTKMKSQLWLNITGWWLWSTKNQTTMIWIKMINDFETEKVFLHADRTSCFQLVNHWTATVNQLKRPYVNNQHMLKNRLITESPWGMLLYKFGLIPKTIKMNIGLNSKNVIFKIYQIKDKRKEILEWIKIDAFENNLRLF